MKNFKKICLVFIFLAFFCGFTVAVDCGQYNDDENSCNSQDECNYRIEPMGSFCEEKGCWGLPNNATCTNSQNTINKSCVWMTPPAGGWCEEKRCWIFDMTDQDTCENNGEGLSCTWENGFCMAVECSEKSTQGACTGTGWNGGSCAWDSLNTQCYEPACGQYDGNQTACQGATGCEYNNPPFCHRQNCGENSDSSTCDTAGCYWKTGTNMGHCEEVQCFLFDNITLNGAATESGCVSNSYGLNCSWSGDGGWCYRDFTESCSDFTSEWDCMETFYCFWDFNQQTCNDPQGGGGTFIEKWNPGCFIFDVDAGACGNVTGCSWDGSTCSGNPGGINCGNITDSTMCNDIPVLFSCCEWSAGACQETFRTSCWDDMQQPPEGAMYCEDFNSYSNQQLCEQIAGTPWYMPCEWNNQTNHCTFKSDDVFGEGKSGKLSEIDNQKSCESAGGKWITESYCEDDGAGNWYAVPTGKCENKFDEERNCNKACFACENYDTSGNNITSSTIAQTACQNSARGCVYRSDSNAPNGFGFCEPSAAMQKGMAGDCQIDCAGCEFLKDPQTECDNSNANCKWDQSNNICVPKSDRTCEDACDRCYEATACTNIGRGSPGACKWNDGANMCEPSSGSTEICWNGVDDDSDESVDCADSGCFGDPACGGGGGGSNCFAYNDQNSCDSAENCLWMEDAWGGFCENAGALCWKFDGNQTACNQMNATCQYSSAPGGGECVMDFNVGEICWSMDKTACDAGGDDCDWLDDPWCQTPEGQNDQWCQSADGGGRCEHSSMSVDCFQYDSNPAGCGNSSDCIWFDDPWSPTGGFCDPAGMEDCMQYGDSGNCESNGCIWQSGWCDPIGFGGKSAGGGMGMMCFENDGNKAGCQNMTGCSYFQMPQGFCEVKRCMHIFDETECGNTEWCLWEGACTEKSKKCFSYPNQNECTTQTYKDYCEWDSGQNECIPKCMTQPDSSSCLSVQVNSVGFCTYMDGICDPAMGVENFKKMEGGPPTPLGMDDLNDANPSSVDLAGFGVKDMGTALGFGATMKDFDNSAVCNGQMLSWMAGQQGSGEEPLIFLLYLDTDGSTSGNCALRHNASRSGYEFQFRYQANYSGQAVSETYSAYRCSSGEWVAADISLSNMKMIMCTDIGGPMIAVEKSDLKKYPILYNSSVDFRVTVASANETGSGTNPTDTISEPGWFTLGSIDFEIGDMSGYGTNNAKFNDIMKNGFVEFADCFTAEGCQSMFCYGTPYCVNNNLGVHDPDYVDTSTPQLVGAKIESYYDAALVMYDTNKPTNGSLLFYDEDGTCNNLSAAIEDIGTLNQLSKDFKVWHTAELYDDGGTNYLSSPLDASTTYFFKLKICDEGGKCVTSKCSNLTTSTLEECRDCNFVTRIKAPTNWTVSYDINQNGTYEHIQGQVCGTNAGMKTNYTTGRAVNIKLEKSDNSTYLEFIGTRLSKSSLNDKVRTISGSNALKSGLSGNVGYTGMPQETRDKIINNLHPIKCLVKIPGTGDCSALWHCDDDGNNCVDRTNEATLNQTGLNYCIWQIPYCEFSVWAGGNIGSSTTSSGGGRAKMSELAIDSPEINQVGEKYQIKVRKYRNKFTGPTIFMATVKVYLNDELIFTDKTDGSGIVTFKPEVDGEYVITAEKSGWSNADSVRFVLGENLIDTTTTRLTTTTQRPTTTRRSTTTSLTTTSNPTTTQRQTTTTKTPSTTMGKPTTTYPIQKESESTISPGEKKTALASGMIVALFLGVAVIIVLIVLYLKNQPPKSKLE